MPGKRASCSGRATIARNLARGLGGGLGADDGEVRMADKNFTLTATVATLIIGVISGFIPALQSTLLPQLVEEGRLTLAELGQVAMAEAVGTLLAVSLATAMLKPEKLRLHVFAAAIAGLLLDLATAHLSGMEIIAARFAHGLCAGILLWVWVGLLTRIDNPARWIAIYVTAQAATLLVLSSFFAATLLPWGGAMAGFGAVALLYALMAALAPIVPARFAALTQSGGSIMPDRAGWIGLTAVFCQLAAILALWVYIKPFGKQIGLDDATTGLAVSVALGSQILAGLIATAIAGRVRPPVLLVAVSVASVAAVGALFVAGSALPFIAAATVFAFLWMLAPPFHMPYLIEIDPTRRAAIHMATAQLVGVAAGPAIASAAVGPDDVGGALIASAVLYGLAGLIIAATALRRRGAMASAAATG